MKRALFLALAILPAQASMIVNVGGVVVAGSVVGGSNYADNAAGIDANPAVGIMDLGVFLNSVSINFVIRSFGATSGSPLASLTMNANGFLSPAAVLPLAVNFVITDTGYMIPPTSLRLHQTVNLLSSLNGITANAVATGYYGDSNLAFDVDGASTSLATSSLLGGIGINSPSTSGPISGPVPYSLTSAIHVDVLARGGDPIQNLQLNADLSAEAVPESMTVLLMASGLALMAQRKLRMSLKQ